MELLVLFFVNFYKLDCATNPIYCQIKKNKPDINSEYALNLSHNIKKMEQKYGISGNLLAAILMQESKYKLNAVGCQKKCKDFGISQINDHTSTRYGFDKIRLMNDLSYSVEAGAMVLSWFKVNYGSKEKDWYTRYNCGTGGMTSKKTCQNYKKLVQKYL